MKELQSVIKLGLVAALITLLVAVAFLIGYQAGNKPDELGTTVATENLTLSEDSPTPTSTVAATALSVEDAPMASDTPAPTVPDPTQTDFPAPTLTKSADTKVPESTATERPPTAIPEATLEPVPTTPPATIAPIPTPPSREARLTDEEALEILREVWDLVDTEFFGELPIPEERAYAAIRGMLETLADDYTSFSEPSIAEIRREDASGSFEGIGAFVDTNEENILEIVQPFKGSPAQEAGLLPGDLVLAVDGQSIVGYATLDAITLIRGPGGTEVTLTIQRGTAEPFDVTIVRARLDIPIVESQVLEGDIGHVRLAGFDAQATLQLEKAIEELFEQGATTLILDLRGNPGGFLNQAVQVSDLFLDEGLILIERRSDGTEVEFPSTDDGLAQDVPLVVLVNGGSASASEIVAGAIQDRGRAVLIGETTFGKGSVQLLHTLSDGSELRVTVARWFTPNDKAIHGEGLIPDIEVSISPEDLEAGRDPQLDRAIEFLKTEQ